MLEALMKVTQTSPIVLHSGVRYSRIDCKTQTLFEELLERQRTVRGKTKAHSQKSQTLKFQGLKPVANQTIVNHCSQLHEHKATLKQNLEQLSF